jgi:transposase
VLADKCASCDAELPKPKFFEKRVIEEIPKPQPILVTEFVIAHYECTACGAETVANHPECPASGMFGPNVLALAALMKHKWRMPYRMTCEVMQTLYDMTLTAATALDMNRRVSDMLEPEYDNIKQNIRDADIVYSDETGAPMDGANWWNWAFSTPTGVLFAIRNNRSSDVPEEILGDEFDGAMMNDGWKPYGEYAKERGLRMGRCWSHILREADDLAEKMPQAKEIADKLHKILYEAKEEVERNPSMKRRRRLYVNRLRRLKRLQRKRFRKQKARKFMEKLERARTGLMTFVLVPGMEPTNNRSERNLREQVIQRKISRTFRSEKGVRINEIEMSAFATWQARGLNCYAEILKRLT